MYQAGSIREGQGDPLFVTAKIFLKFTYLKVNYQGVPPPQLFETKRKIEVKMKRKI